MLGGLAGALLVASPRIGDGVLSRGVCLIVHQDERGTIGVLLNRPIVPQGPEFWEAFLGGQAAPPNLTLHFGGPVGGPLVALHRQQELAEAGTANGVYLAAQRQHLQQLLSASADEIRLIVGHTRWHPGALEAEVAEGLWYLLPATVENVFESNEQMWPTLVRQGAGLQLAAWVGATPAPHPSCN